MYASFLGIDAEDFVTMKSAFGSKRRARKIEVDEDEDGNSAKNKPSSSITTEEVKTCKSPLMHVQTHIYEPPLMSRRKLADSIFGSDHILTQPPQENIQEILFATEYRV